MGKNRAFEILETKEGILAENDAIALQVREELRAGKTFFVNLMASPGAGKTTTLLRTIEALKDRWRIGVMEADVDSDVDARAIAKTGVKVIQLHTGGSCHMDAAMTKKGLDGLGLEDVDVVFLENVGNLVCPAEFQVGADVSAVILSVPEGDDKPLKYPLMFTVGDVLLINKTDCLPVFDFDVERCRRNIAPLNDHMEYFPLSAKTKEGFDAWIDWLDKKIRETVGCQ
ncbi:MAG: hydrogenase nickel incorporation protein HypB [Lachnospiraceae bacterium]|nr:hydrogenase nickel incorporation protein HypB [Lachnospiraceae bacterium]